MHKKAIAALAGRVAAVVRKAHALVSDMVSTLQESKKGEQRERRVQDLRPLLDRASRRRALYSAIGQAAEASDLLRARALWEHMDSPFKLWWEEQWRFARSSQDLKQAIRQVYQADEACYPVVARVLADSAPGEVPKQVETVVQPLDEAMRHLTRAAERYTDAG
ncbi:MAG: hypothetical protein HY690_17910 [Chloroflexi bacterium]|nr:hypothetical protein [Chloroflexota bacterium]